MRFWRKANPNSWGGGAFCQCHSTSRTISGSMIEDDYEEMCQLLQAISTVAFYGREDREWRHGVVVAKQNSWQHNLLDRPICYDVLST
jgi:hypothetical protein